MISAVRSTRTLCRSKKSRPPYGRAVDAVGDVSGGDGDTAGLFAGHDFQGLAFVVAQSVVAVEAPQAISGVS